MERETGEIGDPHSWQSRVALFLLPGSNSKTSRKGGRAFMAKTLSHGQNPTRRRRETVTILGHSTAATSTEAAVELTALLHMLGLSD